MVLTRILRISDSRVWYRVMEDANRMSDAASTLIDEFGADFVVSCVDLEDDPHAKPPWIKPGGWT